MATLFQEPGSSALREHRTREKLNQQVIKDAKCLGEGKGRRESVKDSAEGQEEPLSPLVPGLPTTRSRSLGPSHPVTDSLCLGLSFSKW